MTRRLPALVIGLTAAALGCGGEAAGARSDSAAAQAAGASASPAAAPAYEASASDSVSDSAASAAGVGLSRDSLRKLAHRHPPMPRAAAGALTEEAVQNVVDAINAADAGIAAPAVAKASNAEVKRFASTLASSHPQKVTDSPPQTTDAGGIVAPLHDLLTQSTTRLAGMTAGPAFDRAFVDAQIAAHERAIAVLDSIRPAARTGDLPALVASTRAQVVRHLDEARALQRRLSL